MSANNIRLALCTLYYHSKTPRAIHQNHILQQMLFITIKIIEGAIEEIVIIFKRSNKKFLVPFLSLPLHFSSLYLTEL